MKIEVFNKHKEVVQASTLGLPDETGPSYRKSSYSIVQKYWTSDVTEIKAGEIQLAVHKIDVKEQVSLKTYAAPAMVGMLFLEKGSIQVKQQDSSFREIGNLHHNLIINSQKTEETLFLPDQQINLTTVNFPPEYFFKLAEGGSASIDRMATRIDRDKANAFVASNNLSISLPMLRLLSSFDSNVYNTASLRLSTESKILELLSLQIAQIEDSPQNAVVSKLSDGDIKRINQAREYILSDLSFTPTLESISFEVGINVFKLKTGFKALFGQSVFSYLREERLVQAYHEINKGNSSLTDIAYQTGFASISHFSDAFKNRYGVPPSQLR
ncbi:helix-turn-helix transcriptional regulator [Dyadobacter aurulentus]|uniref:helix-turn-helix transcriptional regulator n=1 Tax=Dyadobacter sp. UC 10 TaxID=2605428 RepID=UPI001788B894|nr:AraC family transcriptional regulator [Dyadobacter sp. UC 10]